MILNYNATTNKQTKISFNGQTLQFGYSSLTQIKLYLLSQKKKKKSFNGIPNQYPSFHVQPRLRVVILSNKKN